MLHPKPDSANAPSRAKRGRGVLSAVILLVSHWLLPTRCGSAFPAAKGCACNIGETRRWWAGKSAISALS